MRLSSAKSQHMGLVINSLLIKFNELCCLLLYPSEFIFWLTFLPKFDRFILLKIINFIIFYYDIL